MEFPLEVSVRGERFNWEEAEQEVRKRVSKLGRFSENITKMRVVVDSPHRKRHDGLHHVVRIEISLPGKTIAINRERNQRDYEDVRVCIRDAFDSARRQLEDYMRLKRHDVKRHEEPPTGTVQSKYPHMDYGIIMTPDGYEVYFHRNSVLGDGFDSLQEGDPVRYNPASGDKGPQASSVFPLGR